MTAEPTPRNGFALQEPGTNDETWGDILNDSGVGLIDASLDGWAAYTLSAPKTLTATPYVANEARMRVQNITGGTGDTITVPSVEKWWWVRNASSGSVTITTGAGATAVVPSGGFQAVFCNGSNCYIARDQTLYEELVAYVIETAFATQAGNYPGLSRNAGKPLRVNDDEDSVEWGFEKKPWELKTASFTAELNGRYEVDSSGGAVTVTLPAASNSGLGIEIADKGAAGINNITLDPAGSNTVAGAAENYIIDFDGDSLTLIDRSGGWDVRR